MYVCQFLKDGTALYYNSFLTGFWYLLVAEKEKKIHLYIPASTKAKAQTQLLYNYELVFASLTYNIWLSWEHEQMIVFMSYSC